MRRHLLTFPLAFVALATAAEAAPPQQQIVVPNELADPAIAERLGDMMQTMSNVFLNLPVGEIEAAAQGRQPTAQEKGLTIREMERREDPDFDRKFAQDIAAARPMMKESMKAFARSLPAITRALSEAANEIERATANLPQPR